jgi:hypothetical protein
MHSYADRGHDLHETPEPAIRTLLQTEKLPHWIWEPAAGRGAIVNALRDHGHAVIASDICDWGFPLHFVADFLTTTKAPGDCNTIITNPPFKLADEFVRHALRLSPHVIMLLRLKFYESKRRRDILEGGHLARVHAFADRLPMMHRDGWGGPKSSSTECYAWFCWDRGHDGPTILNRISWRSVSVSNSTKQTKGLQL